MPGVRIGNGAIIASRSVVVKDIEPYTIVGGNPATVIKKRFDTEIVDLLERIAWWDWSAEKITENLEVLVSLNVERLEKLV